MNMKEWAENEVRIACSDEGEESYGNSCLSSALKAFTSLCEDGHSGMSIQFTKSILNRLIAGKPLSPIEDKDNIWKFSFEDTNGVKNYQCIRYSSLFKEVYPDGAVKYKDTESLYRIIRMISHLRYIVRRS